VDAAQLSEKSLICSSFPAGSHQFGEHHTRRKVSFRRVFFCFSTKQGDRSKESTMANAAERELLEAAWEARERAYCVYSGFAVGAALRGEDGQIFAGCNVENLSFGLTMCAERVAVGHAVAAGVRVWKEIVVVADTMEPISPCGACRQVLAEFAPDLAGSSWTKSGRVWRWKLGELLPRASVGILDQPSEEANR
jgi:cytidine deaminase